MTDTPWRDVYDDPEGMACAVEEIEEWLIARHYYPNASIVAAAAACIRELAEREVATAPAPEPEDKPLLNAALLPIRQAHIALTGEWEPEPGILFRAKTAVDYLRGALIAAGFEARDFAVPAAPTPAPEGAFRAGWLAAMRECGEEPTPPEECAAYHVALSGQPAPEQEGREPHRSIVARVEVGEGAHMAFPDPRAHEEGGAEWVARYGDVVAARFQVASLLESMESLLTTPRLGEAIRRVRLMRNAYRELLTPERPDQEGGGA